MASFKRRHKLVIESGALLLTVIAAAPIYVGLQSGSAGLAWAGLILAAAGMGIGLWGS